MTDLKITAPVTHYENNVSSEPLVSVSIVTYNHKNYIKQCLDGVLMQETSFPIEVLLGEDASADGTREICIEYAEKHPDKIRLFLHDRSNVIYIGGQPTGRFNFLYNLNQARGKYIALCEGDDYWTDPYKLQKQVDFLEENSNTAMVFTNRMVLSPDGKLSENIYENKIYTSSDILRGFIPPTQTIAFKNEQSITGFFKNIKNFYSGDRLLAYICSQFGNIRMLPEITAVYRNSGSGIWSSKKGLDTIKHQTKVFKEFHELIGLPSNNEYCAELQFKNFVVTFTYCLKRPILFFKDGNLRFLYQVWRSNGKMNRWYFLFQGFKQKFKRSQN